MGRPPTLDKDQTLMAAMSACWMKCYAASFMKDLSTAMGISGHGIYAAFRVKREIYPKTIDRCADVDCCAPILAFDGVALMEEDAWEFLTYVVSHSTQQQGASRGSASRCSKSTKIMGPEYRNERDAALSTPVARFNCLCLVVFETKIDFYLQSLLARMS